MSVSDCYRGQTTGIFVSGKIDYGYVEINRKLLIMPKNEFCIVKSIVLKLYSSVKNSNSFLVQQIF